VDTVKRNRGLTQSAIALDAHLDYAAREDSSCLSFLNRLLNDESDARRKRSEETRLMVSYLPYKKTLAEFDLSFQLSLDERQIRELDYTPARAFWQSV
jgi:DNA replication protein DnaC